MLRSAAPAPAMLLRVQRCLHWMRMAPSSQAACALTLTLRPPALPEFSRSSTPHTAAVCTSVTTLCPAPALG